MHQTLRLSALVAAAALAAWLPAAHGQAPSNGRSLPDAYLKGMEQCAPEHVSRSDYVELALAARSDAEAQQMLRKAIDAQLGNRARCLREQAGKFAGNAAVAADLSARLARNDKDVEKPFVQARDAVEGDPVGTFKPMIDGAALADARQVVAVARDYKTVPQACPPLAPVVPRTPEDTQAANRTLTAHRECLLKVGLDARDHPVDFHAEDFERMTAQVTNMERYTCARKPGPRCLPDASWRAVAELFSPANAALVRRAAQTQDNRMPELKEAKARMDAWREQVSAIVRQRNAEIAEGKRQRQAEQDRRDADRRQAPVYYSPAPIEPPPTPYRRDSSVSAPGMR